MDNATTMVKDRVQVKDAAGAASSVFAGQAVGTVGIVSGLIGLWAISCMVCAVISSGPLSLISGWFASVM
ncbi:MAG: hypothetical protein OEL55_01340 [Desulfobulbaceae bacterium]|nr:hypothetical protein [Desulfobulbaceae bacterium]